MITIEHLSKRYGTLEVLRDVHTEIARGEVIALIGASGSGKSTLLRCLNLLERPSGGRILVDGVDLTSRGTDLSRIRRKIGMVFQAFHLFSHLRVLDNLTLGMTDLRRLPPSQARREALELLERVGLADKAASYPDELSGGQQQRVAIARALAMQPEALLLDEPTSALDPTMVEEVLEVVRGLAGQGLTLLIVTHEMRFARDVSSRMWYMDEGVIFEDGTPDQIYHQPRHERTRNFLHRMHWNSFTAERGRFNPYALDREIDRFGQMQHLEHRQIKVLQLVMQEILAERLLPAPSVISPVAIRVGAAENTGKLEVVLEYDGARFNPFEMKSAGDVSMEYLRQQVRSVEAGCQDGRNTLRIDL